MAALQVVRSDGSTLGRRHREDASDVFSDPLDLESSITHTFPLDEVNTALKYLHEKIEIPIRVAVTL